MRHIRKFNEEVEESGKWAIFAGLGGGFGGATFKEVVECSREEAEKQAYYSAVEDYDNHSGMNGLRDTSDIMEEDSCEEDEAEQIYNEEREGWLDYYVEPFDENKEYE